MLLIKVRLLLKVHTAYTKDVHMRQYQGSVIIPTSLINNGKKERIQYKQGSVHN